MLALTLWLLPAAGQAGAQGQEDRGQPEDKGHQDEQEARDAPRQEGQRYVPHELVCFTPGPS